MTLDELLNSLPDGDISPARQQAGFSVDDVLAQLEMDDAKQSPMYKALESASERGENPELVQRLANTGVTPGNVGDWARIRMAQQQERQGSPLAPDQAKAIYDAMQMIAMSRSPETAQETPEFKPSQPGAAGNILRAILGPNFGGLAYGAQSGLGQIAGLLGDERAQQEWDAMAANSAMYQPNLEGLSGIAGGIVGGIAGGIPSMLAGPAGVASAAINQSGLAAADIERRRLSGQDIGRGAAMADILGKGAVAAIMTKLGQKNITGPAAINVVSKVIPQVAKNMIGRMGVVGAGEAGLGAANQLLNNIIEYETGVNPDIELDEGVWHAALTQGGIGFAGRGIHERLSDTPRPPKDGAIAQKAISREPAVQQVDQAQPAAPVEAPVANRPATPTMDAEQQARFSEPIETDHWGRSPRPRQYKYEELRKMNASQLRVAAETAGVAFDTPGTTIPRILDAQETARSTRISEAQRNAQRIIAENRRNEIATMSDQELYAAVKAAGGRASNRLANIDFLLKKEFPETPAPAPAPTPEPVQPAEVPPTPERPVVQPPESPMPPEPMPVEKPVEQPPKPPERPQPAEVDPRVREIDDAIKMLEDQIPNAKGKEKASLQDRIEMLKIIRSRPMPAAEPPKPAQAQSPEPVRRPPTRVETPEETARINADMEKMRWESMKKGEDYIRKSKALESMESTKALAKQGESATSPVEPAPAPDEAWVKADKAKALEAINAKRPVFGPENAPAAKPVEPSPIAEAKPLASPDPIAEKPANAPKGAPQKKITKAEIERRLIEEYDKQGGSEIADKMDTSVSESWDERGTTFYHPDAPKMPTPAFGQKTLGMLPGEVRNFLEGRAHLRKKFKVTSDPKASMGEDVMANNQDYFDMIEHGGQSKSRRAIEWASNHPDPELQMLAMIHREMPSMKDRKGMGVLDPSEQPINSKFRAFGREFEIVSDPETGEPILKDGPDFEPMPASYVKRMPYDEGTFEQMPKKANAAKQEALEGKIDPEPIEAAKDQPGVQLEKQPMPVEGLEHDMDLLGRPAFKRQGNTQSEMIFEHEPVKNPLETKPIEDVPGQTKMFGEADTPAKGDSYLPKDADVTRTPPDDIAPFLPEKGMSNVTDAQADESLKRIGVKVKRSPVVSKAVSAATKILEKTTGRKVVNCSKIVGDMGGGNVRSMDGFVDPQTGAIYINANKPLAGYVSVFAHEWMHTVQKYMPDTAKAFHDAIPENARAKYLNDYILRAGGRAKFDAYVARNGRGQIEMEIGAMAMGDAATRVRVRNALMKKDFTVWEKITDVWQRFADKIRGKSEIIDKAIETIERDAGTAGPVAGKPDFLPGKNPLPKDVRRRDELRKGAISAETMRADFRINEMKSLVKESWGVPVTKLSDVQINAIDARLRGHANPGVPLPKSLEKAIDKARSHLNRLENGLVKVGLLDQNAVQFNRMTRGMYLNRAYRMFEDKSYKPTPASRAAMEAEVAKTRNISADEAKVAVEEMEADWKEGGVDSFLGFGKLGKKNMSILKQRQDLSPVMREFLGEYTDPFSNYIRSTSKMASLLENHKFLSDVKKIGTQNGWLFEQGKAQPGYTTRIATEGSAVMAPLDGMRTSPEIAKAFTQASLNASDVLVDTGKAIAMANFAAKSAVTLGSIRFHVRNLLQQPMFSIANGHFGFWKYGKAAKAAFSVIVGKGDDAQIAYIDRLKRLGILGQGVHAREMLADLKAIGLIDMDLSQPGWKNAVMSKGRTAIKAPGRFAGLVDDFGKIYGFENELARAKEAFPGMKLSEMREWAANRVLDTYPTYSRVPQVIRKFGRVGGLFKAPFLSFWTESIRTIGNSILYAASDLRSGNTALMKHGAQRLAGLTLALGGSVAAAKATKAMFGITQADEERNRAGLPDWQKDNTLIYSSKDRFYDSSVFTPHNQLIDPIMTLLSGKGDIDNRMIRAITQGLQPVTSDQLATAIYKDIIKNKTRDGIQIYSREDWEGDDPAKKAKAWADMTGYIIQQMFEPGTMRDIRRKIMPAIKEGKGVADEVLAATTGIRSGRVRNLEDIMRKSIANRSEYYATTQEDRDRQRMLSKAAELAAAGDEDGLSEMEKKYEITEQEMDSIYRKSEETTLVSLFKKLTAKEAQKIWQYATPEEKEELWLDFYEKVENSKLPDDEKDAIMMTIDK